ncbi:MAG: XRE family transcriptional regulator [Methyloglobulus sp.]|nr:XRE family transcriptional regulator [Methyloglobulus sp.]
MQYEEFRRQLGKAGLTNRAFAELLDLNPISISNLKSKVEVPYQLALIASFIADYKDRGYDFMEVINKCKLDR